MVTPELPEAVGTHGFAADGSLWLWLGEGCIETCARRVHRLLVAEILAGEAAQPYRAGGVALLEQFLTGADFARLRYEHPVLAGAERVRVCLRSGSAGEVKWELA